MSGLGRIVTHPNKGAETELRLGLAATRLAAAEALDATARVHQLLTAGVERMAVRADLDVDLPLGRSRRELVPAGAADVSLYVLRMDFGLHVVESSLGDQLRLQ